MIGCCGQCRAVVSDFGSKSTIVIDEGPDTTRAVIDDDPTTRLRAGIEPRLIRASATVAIHHFEMGVLAFDDFTWPRIGNAAEVWESVSTRQDREHRNNLLKFKSIGDTVTGTLAGVCSVSQRN